MALSITQADKGLWVLQSEQFIKLGLEKTFEFFSKAENLGELIPSFLRFDLLTPSPITMERGAIIQYRIHINRVPLRWRTLISEWEPPFRFVDVQQKGPYRFWRHEHTFESRQGGTLMKDRVEFRMPFGPLGKLALFLSVRKQLEAIWAHRERRIDELLNQQQPSAEAASG